LGHLLLISEHIGLAKTDIQNVFPTKTQRVFDKRTSRTDRQFATGIVDAAIEEQFAQARGATGSR